MCSPASAPGIDVRSQPSMLDESHCPEATHPRSNQEYPAKNGPNESLFLRKKHRGDTSSEVCWGSTSGGAWVRHSKTKQQEELFMVTMHLKT